MQRAVLALLALNPGRVVSLDRLIDELWADQPPSSATTTLQVYISNLRKVLEPGRQRRTPPKVLLTREPGYQLAVAPDQVDLVRFTTSVEDGRKTLARREYGKVLEVLDQALGMWRGEPLAEFSVYEFAQPVIARLAEFRAVAVEDRFEARLAMGDSLSCVADLERLVEVYPFRERLWGLLVLALYRSGRQTDALGALRRARALLAEEMGLEPGPELRRLEQAVLEQSADLDVSSPVLSEVSPPLTLTADRRHITRARADAPIARDEQLGRLAERFSALRQGRGGVLSLTGEAGVGKTHLARLAASEAESQGITVVWGRCVEAEAAPPFWPWLQALRELGERGRVAARLMAGEGTDTTADPGRALFELYEHVLSALTGVGTPTMLILDDLHSADASSLRLLTFLASELHRRPILVLATLRPEPGREPEHLGDTLAALVREPGTELLPLPPFTLRDVRAFLEPRGVTDPAFARILYERTGGNPFYLVELLRLLGSEHRLDSVSSGIPQGVREVIGRRVSRLPDQTRELLGQCAVLGRDVSLDVLTTLAGVPAEQVMSALEPAVATGVLIETVGGFDYRFSHALVRDALYAGLSRLEKARLHLRAGQALEGLPGGDNASLLPILAHHFAMGARVGGADKAVEYAARAARQATAQRAYDEAVELWDKALLALGQRDPARRCRLLIELGRALRVIGDVDRGRMVLDEAIELAAEIGDKMAVVEAVIVFGGHSVWMWRPYGVVEERRVALLESLLKEPLDDPDRAALLGTLGLELYYGPRRAEGERLAAEAVQIARRVGDPALLFRVLNNYALATRVCGREKEQRSAADEMLGLPGLSAAAQIVALTIRMSHLLKDGEFADWQRDRLRVEQLAQEVRRPELTAMMWTAEAAYATLHGRWAEAERLVLEADELLSRWWIVIRDFVRFCTIFTCRRAQGRVTDIAEELIARAAEPDMYPLRPLAVLAALDVGDPDQARELMGRWGTDVRDDWLAEFHFVVWGHVAVELGAPDLAELYRRLSPHGDRLVDAGSGQIVSWGSTHQVLAKLAAAMGDRERALDHARRAHEIHLRLGLDYWAGQSRQLLTRLGASPHA
ncbi:BTAD domain-containing putative transcriptional regulator [Microbispora sp. NPDC046933]|uniref:ATP-binding protein n=1 Tax=Microbispora sp. NPDC046933 TaxID=3155618 RepID=UPI0033F0DD20